MTESIPQGVSPDTVSRIGETIGRAARATIVYGDPIVREGVTVVPVAKIRYGFGGAHRGGSDAGTGGGLRASPLGYIEIRDGQSNYRQIEDPTTHIMRLAVGGALGLLVLRAARRLLRR